MLPVLRRGNIFSSTSSGGAHVAAHKFVPRLAEGISKVARTLLETGCDVLRARRKGEEKGMREEEGLSGCYIRYREQSRTLNNVYLYHVCAVRGESDISGHHHDPWRSLQNEQQLAVLPDFMRQNYRKMR